MSLRGSHLVALLIAAAIGGWMLTGNIIRGGQADPNAETIVEREKKRASEAFRVRVARLNISERNNSLAIRGRTQADAIVSVRAETGGTVEQRPVFKGQTVKPGDLLCVIDKGIRTTQLNQANAQLAQARADYEANEDLVERGFATRSKLREMRTALDVAKAAVATAEQDMTRTEVRATVAGTVQEPLAEVGDNLTPSGVCATLLDSDPMLFSGQVAERNVSDLKVDMEADVSLISGERVKGKIRYISPVADANTRTFNIEIELPNRDGGLRDGMTASATIDLAPTKAFKVDPNWLTLDDDGQVGVRVVQDDKTVAFKPVKILAQEADAMWVTGLEDGLNVITLGQNFIAAGEKVEPVSEAEMKREQSASSTNDGPAVKSETN